jgi:mechanosensitive ion channel-like protein
MTTPVIPINTWGDSIFLALTNALNMFLAAIPLVVGALLILIIGWIISSIAARATTAALRRVGVDRAYAEHGQSTYGQGRAASWQPSTVAGDVVKWVIRLVFLVAAANTLGLSQVSLLLNQIILWIPNLIVAAIVLLVAPLLAKFVRGLIEAGAGEMGFSNAPLLGRLAQYAIIAFAAIIAINQIGIAANLVNTLFIGLVGAVALAFGLAFGLGGRDVAARMTEQWYASSQQAATRVQTAAKQASSPGGAKKPADETAKVYRPAPARSEP